MRRRGSGDPNSAEGGAGGTGEEGKMAPSRCRSSRTFTTENRSGAASLTYCTIYSPSAAHSLAHLNKTFHVIGMLIFSEGGETRDREAPPLRPHPYTDADWLALHHRKNLACNVRGRNEKEQSESKQVSQSRHSFFRPRNQMRPLARYMEMETTQKGSRSRETCAAQAPQATATAAGTSASRLA